MNSSVYVAHIFALQLTCHILLLNILKQTVQFIKKNYGTFKKNINEVDLVSSCEDWSSCSEE